MATFSKEYLGAKILLNRHGYHRRYYGVSVKNSIGNKAYLGSANSKKEGFAVGERFLFEWNHRRRN